MRIGEQIIGEDCEGRPVPAGALVVAVGPAVKPECRGDVFRVTGRVGWFQRRKLNKRAIVQGNWLNCDDGMVIIDRHTRLVRKDQTPASEGFEQLIHRLNTQKITEGEHNE